VLDGVQAGRVREHPAGEDALDVAGKRDLVDLNEARRVLNFRRRSRVAGARRHLQRAELHRLVNRGFEIDDAAGDLVEPGEHRGRIGNALERCLLDRHFGGFRRVRVVGVWRSLFRRSLRLGIGLCL